MDIEKIRNTHISTGSVGDEVEVSCQCGKNFAGDPCNVVDDWADHVIDHIKEELDAGH